MEILLGRNPVREALRARCRRIHEIMIAEGAQEKGALADIVALAQAQGVPVSRVRRQELDQLAGDVMHQGVAARASDYRYAEIDEMLALARERGEAPFLLALDSIQDPHNVGSLLRTSEAVGVHGVILPSRRSAAVTAAATRASAGAAEHLLVAQVTNLARTL